MTDAIVTYKKSAITSVERLRSLLNKGFEPCLAMIGRNFPGDMPDSKRAMKTKALIEQAAIHIANSQAKDKILRCTGESIIQSLCDCAALNLSLQQATGEGYLIPFKYACTYMVGYRGFITLMCRTGAVTSVQVECVYEGEEFKMRGGTDHGIEHEIRIDVERRDDKIIAVYAIFHLRTGPPIWCVMNREEIAKVQQTSKAVQKGKKCPWDYFWGEMAKKSVIRRGQKMIPKSGEDHASDLLIQAMEMDNRDYGVMQEQARLAMKEHGRDLRQQAEAAMDQPKESPKPKQEMTPDGVPVPDDAGYTPPTA